MCSRSLTDSKVWMMTKYQAKQTKAANPHGIHSLDCCKYHLSATKSWRGLTTALRATETGPFILSNNLLRSSSPRINAFYWFWFGVFLVVQGFAHKYCGSRCILPHLAETTEAQPQYQMGSMPTTSPICAAEEGFHGSFWSSLTNKQTTQTNKSILGRREVAISSI